mgnify:CR=1 FL=1
MYAIIVYDIKVERVNKVKGFLRKHLNWIQNSVFEGDLTEMGLRQLKRELEHIIDKDEDSIIIYKFGTLKYSSREILGREKNSTSMEI